ncbi:MAG: PBP1A family penicillin-binding protein [Hyphomicrobiales bacterium]|nr:PBP1A family penicillin-binding protein [Hyphomicrobiales bacterium]MDE2114258.1 PBP1A family penicillin-binding protein [Hyphomicrobiales bacterium]
MRRKSSGSSDRQEPWFGEGKAPAGRDDELRATRDDPPPRKTSPKKPAAKNARRSRKHRSWIGRLFYWSFVLAVWGMIGAAGVFAYYSTKLPPIDQLAIPKRPPNISILGSNGVLLTNRGDSGGAAVHLNELPPYLPNAFVAIEDRRFYSHFGIDPVGIARAIFRDLTGHGGLQGGSTLTQQLAKNLFLTQERTLSRKVEEAILALWLEHKYTKSQILELYLNRVYFGSGAFGVEAAAQKYFGHSARDVTLAESAMLAGLMKAPTRLAPNHNLHAATDRAAIVVAAMAQQHLISEAMAQVALAQNVHVVQDKSGSGVNYAADYVMDALSDQISSITQDIVVDTTINPNLQHIAETTLEANVAKVGAKLHISQGAMVAMKPDGSIVSLVGGVSYADSQFNRAVSAKRQPGSSFKPFVYLTAIEGGLTPDTYRKDAPINVRGWKPSDFEKHFEGDVTLRHALAQSINTVSVRLALEFGPRAVIQTAHRLGILSQLQPNASIALGTSEVTPLELVSAYAPFANGGIAVLPHIIKDVHTTDGKVLYRFKGADLGRVVAPQNVAMMNDMMTQVVRAGTARRAQLPAWQIAGKTGTSQNFHDAWFIGYSSQLITGVWVGNDDNSPMRGVTGGSLPALIWHNYMQAALQNVPPTQLPYGIWAGNGQTNPPGDAIDPPDDMTDASQAAAKFVPHAPTQPGAPLTINHAGASARQDNGEDVNSLSNKDRNLLDRLLGN